ncbi:hypothetical protein Q0S62_03805 [Stenotrophomonas indicatrix]|uniref:hypothetical protein n=1 Tax=Stenotrophomonas indicatrix TaxID=2045451 RepID=UPI0026537B55|nr:hypothetical protein [Stenotrophomonas indicatrix]MDN8647540.1 hypothetical protein [Stenotrophomonas indicatrix]
MAWIYCRACFAAKPALVGADRWSALKLTQPSTHGVDLLDDIHAWRGSTAGPASAAKPALVGADRWSALKLTQPSTHGVDLLRCIHAWRGSTGRHPRVAWIY